MTIHTSKWYMPKHPEPLPTDNATAIELETFGELIRKVIHFRALADLFGSKEMHDEQGRCQISARDYQYALMLRMVQAEQVYVEEGPYWATLHWLPALRVWFASVETDAITEIFSRAAGETA